MVLLDVPLMEQQLLGLVWRGGKIDHPGGEHDDWANAVAGCVALVAQPSSDVGEPILVRPGGDRPELEGGATTAMGGFSLIRGGGFGSGWDAFRDTM